MTKDAYLRALDKYLKKLPEQDYQDAMDYFQEYFDEAGPENEEEAITELGSPKEAAREILGKLLDDKKEEDSSLLGRNGKSILWITLLSLLLAPMAFPLVIASIAIVIAIVVTVAALLFSLVVVGLVLLANGIYVLGDSFHYLSNSLANFSLSLGMGFGMLAVALAALMAGYKASVLIINGGWALIQWLIQKSLGGRA
ncbi:DUF1700 domain-containing protein [Streptococcus iniae]|uniref:DUF1700 domain-containing protein n=1 Tax=Streptococcus iniae TaxID=1346 RepID=UPI0008D9267D|nr:DUF1700 domain-containing protein [Streptococcus iniae]OHX27062.1 hypothetical protein BKX95_07200 [Streptococcus iniae]RLV28554.1 DUF1700 domain-containing protein [Streptococcus iniae]